MKVLYGVSSWRGGGERGRGERGTTHPRVLAERGNVGSAQEQLSI